MDARLSPASDVRVPFSRTARTLRGALGAVFSTLIAAASHALAGGDLTVLAVAATAILTLPLCVALSGRMGSLWRLTVAVCSAQFLFHWAFAGLGAPSRIDDRGVPLPLHAEHLAALQTFTPATLGASADALMWVGHAVAAALTIALLYRGERAATALCRAFLRAVTWATRESRLACAPRRVPLSRITFGSALRARLLSVAAISRRGPPSLSKPIGA